MPGPWQGIDYLLVMGDRSKTTFKETFPLKSHHYCDTGFVLCSAFQNKDLCVPLLVGLHELKITGAVSNDSILISA